MEARSVCSWSVVAAALALAAAGCSESAQGGDGGNGDAVSQDRPGDVGADEPAADRPGDDACTPPAPGAMGLPGPPLLETATDPAAQPRPALPALADLDRDCRLDLVVPSGTEPVVLVSRGLDGGRFEPPVRIATGAIPRAVAAADLDGDGALDLLVAVPDARAVLTVRATGALTFEAPRSIALDGDPPVAVAGADLDGDGDREVVVLSADYSRWGHESASASLRLLVAEGGTLAARPPLWTLTGGEGGGPSWLRLVDVDADGRLDLLASGPMPVTVLRNHGGLSFSGPTVVEGAFGEPALADIDGDGRVDVAARTAQGVGVFPGLGGGRFGAARPTGFGGGRVGSLVAADFDRDGRVDLAASAVRTDQPTPTPQEATVLRDRGDGVLVPAQVIRTGAGEPWPAALLAADLDRDGRPDLAAVRSSSAIVLLAGAAGLVAPSYVPVGPTVRWAVGGDLDGDGGEDVVAVRPASREGPVALDVLRNQGGDLRPPVTFTASTGASWPGEVALGDLDGDGRLDAVVTQVGAARLSTLRGRGDGSFDAPVEVATGEQPDAVALGDLDGDGDLDAVVGNVAGLDVFINRGGALGGRAAYPGGSHLWRGAVAVADLDGDRAPEVSSLDAMERVVRVRHNRGDGTFDDAALVPVGESWGPLTAGDVDGDGDTDLVACVGQGVSPGSLRVLENVGGGRLRAGASYPTGMQPSAVRVADVDHDGRVDLVVANRTANGNAPSVGVLRGAGGGTFGAQRAYPLVGYAYALVVADFDRDGRSDVAATVDWDATSAVAVLRNRVW